MTEAFQMTVVCVAVLFASAGQVQGGIVINVAEVGGDQNFSGNGPIDLESTLGFSSAEAGNTTFGFQKQRIERANGIDCWCHFTQLEAEGCTI